MKRLFIFLLTYILLLSGCSPTKNTENNTAEIVCTNFPYYDFAKNIAGDRLKVTLLVPVGSEIHSFEPTPNDIITLEEAELFIANGGESEVWAGELLEVLDKKPSKTVFMTDAVPLLKNGEHNDEHIWTSPRNAKIIAEKIFSEISEIDAENADYYRENLSIFSEKLDRLDEMFKEALKAAKRNTVIFGDRFPFLYLMSEYGIEYMSAFSGCSELTEPVPKAVAELTDKVMAENIPVVFYTEFSNRKICDTICEGTGAKPMLLHSVHNLTKDEFDKGLNYISIMTENAKALKEALG